MPFLYRINTLQICMHHIRFIRVFDYIIYASIFSATAFDFLSMAKRSLHPGIFFLRNWLFASTIFCSILTFSSVRLHLTFKLEFELHEMVPFIFLSTNVSMQRNSQSTRLFGSYSSSYKIHRSLCFTFSFLLLFYNSRSFSLFLSLNLYVPPHFTQKWMANAKIGKYGLLIPDFILHLRECNNKNMERSVNRIFPNAFHCIRSLLIYKFRWQFAMISTVSCLYAYCYHFNNILINAKPFS